MSEQTPERRPVTDRMARWWAERRLGDNATPEEIARFAESNRYWIREAIKNGFDKSKIPLGYLIGTHTQTNSSDPPKPVATAPIPPRVVSPSPKVPEFEWPVRGGPATVLRFAGAGVFLHNIPAPPYVYAIGDGRVIYCGGSSIDNFDYFLIAIEHPRKFVSFYIGFGKFIIMEGIQVKDWIRAGAQGEYRPIAELNHNPLPPILFFQLFHKDVLVDPRNYLPPVPGKLGADGPPQSWVERALWSERVE